MSSVSNNSPKPIETLKTCTVCPKTVVKMLVCGKCRITPYCSPECQKTDWSRHKVECKTESERREEAKASRVAFNQMLEKLPIPDNNEHKRIATEIQRLDNELMALVKDHPDRKEFEQMFYQTIPGDKISKRLERKMQGPMTEEEVLKRAQFTAVILPIAIANRRRHKELVQAFEDFSGPNLFSDLARQIQKIADEYEKVPESHRPEIYRDAKTILAILPLIMKCPDNRRLYSCCLQKVNKTVLESLLGEDWAKLSDEKEVEARRKAWSELAPHYDRFVAALHGPMSRS